MITINVKELCRLRGIKSPQTTLRKAGISQFVAQEYLSGKKHRFVTKHIETLCKLLRCTPNDLFSWTPDEPADDYPENTLQVIRKKEIADITQVVKGMTVKEIEEMLGRGKKKDEELKF